MNIIKYVKIKTDLLNTMFFFFLFFIFIIKHILSLEVILFIMMSQPSCTPTESSPEKLTTSKAI